MALDTKLDTQVILDGLGQGVLIFNSDGRLLMDNIAARGLLGTDLAVIREEGWSAVSVLFSTGVDNPEERIDAVRSKALTSERPLRFRIYRSGEYVPCWAAAVTGSDGSVYTMITLDSPDWQAVTDMVDRFRTEMLEAIDATRGHVDLITATVQRTKPDDSVETLSKRISGFTRLVSIHMERTGRLMEMLERLEDIRTGRIRSIVRERRRRIALVDYFEDFVEELEETKLLDPETEPQDIRSRVHTTIPDKVAINASSRYLTRILRELLRNAIMYSLKATPIKISVQVKNQNAQIEMKDEGYGIRAKEFDRVFIPFQRARQPQIISEFGYGLNLYLCKHEVETMNGRMWFESEEGVGTTFFMLLPLWREDGASATTTSTQTAAATTTSTTAAATATSTSTTRTVPPSSSDDKKT